MDLTIAILQYLRMHKVEQKLERVLMSFHLRLITEQLINRNIPSREKKTHLIGTSENVSSNGDTSISAG